MNPESIITCAFYFFTKHSRDAAAHTHAHTLAPMKTHMQSYPYEGLRVIEPANSRD
jgi:hypothetical protein